MDELGVEAGLAVEGAASSGTVEEQSKDGLAVAMLLDLLIEHGLHVFARANRVSKREPDGLARTHGLGNRQSARIILRQHERPDYIVGPAVAGGLADPGQQGYRNASQWPVVGPLKDLLE